MSELPATPARFGRPLRFGILCRGTELSAWQAQCVRQLTAVEGVVPALVLVEEGDPSAGAPGRNGIPLLWRLYQRLTRHKLQSERPATPPGELARVPSLRYRTERNGPSGRRIRAADVAVIRSHELDFILQLSDGEDVRGDVLSAARFGVWAFRHGDPAKYGGGPPCFWEIVSADPITAVSLVRLVDGDESQVTLKENHLRTCFKSYVKARDSAFLASTDLPARVSRDIQLGTGDYLLAGATRSPAAGRRLPTGRETLAFVARLFVNKLRDAGGWLFRHRQWCIGIVDRPIQAFLDPAFAPSIQWLPWTGRSGFVADPFGLQRGSVATILAEELDFASSKGRLVAIEWPDGGSPTIHRHIFKMGVHASYPYLLEHEGGVWCIPETQAANEVALFRALQFPVRWEKTATLVEGVAALDPTLVLHSGRWWMFYGVAGRFGEVSLCAQHAPSLQGPWVPHAANPLKTDVRGSRPAGSPFVEGGVLYRPAQDCSLGYGRAVAIFRVTRLSPTEFSEELHSVVRPPPNCTYSAGVHTLSRLGARTLIDGQRVVFVPLLLFQELRRIIRRRFGGLATRRPAHAPE